MPVAAAPLGALAIDRAFDLEQGVDAPDCLQRQRRDHTRRFALRRAPGVRGEIGHLEEGSAGMDPARRLDDRAGLAVGLVQLVVSAEGIGLEDPGIIGQMRPGVLCRATDKSGSPATIGSGPLAEEEGQRMEERMQPLSRGELSRREVMQTPDEVAAMLRLKALGWGIKRIAKELACSHMTVRHYVAQGGWFAVPRPRPASGAGRA
jgi:hypothetical protein